MNRKLLVGLATLFLSISAFAQMPDGGELIGHSNKNYYATLKVAPNGKGLISSSEFFGKYFTLWNLETHQSFDLQNRYNDRWDKCGWTPDNRIYHFYNPPLNADKYYKKPSAFHSIHNPVGWGFITFQTPLYCDYLFDFAFSAHGDRFFALSASGYGIYETQPVRLLFNRAWPTDNGEGGLHYEGPRLSPSGERILEVETRRAFVDEDKDTWQDIETGRWKLSDARSGRVLRWIFYRPELGIQFDNFLDENNFAAHTNEFRIIYDLKRQQNQWQRLQETVFYLRDSVTLTNPKTGKTTTYTPPRGAYRDIAISPDRRWLYTIDNNGDIFRFPSHR